MDQNHVLSGNIRPGKDQQEEWNNALFWSCIFSALWLLCRILSGLVAGFSANYTNSELSGILLNGLGICLTCLLRESVRSWVIRFFRSSAKHPALFSAILALDFGLLCLFQISSSQVSAPVDIWRLFTGTVLPELTASVLLTMLAYYGGILSPLIYSLITQAAPHFFPVIPKEIWLLELLIEIVLPLLFLMILCMQYDTKPEAQPAGQKSLPTSRRWLSHAGEGLFLLALAGFLAFFLGLLPWHPLAVATGSMEPAIRQGDMAIIANVNTEDLEEGDVIQFRRDQYTVLHRIIAIQNQEDGTICYITQGDANNAADEQSVAPGDVIGRLAGNVPGTGWLTLWMRVE